MKKYYICKCKYLCACSNYVNYMFGRLLFFSDIYALLWRLLLVMLPLSSQASLESFVIINVEIYKFDKDSGVLLTAERNDSLFKIIAYDEVLNTLNFRPKGGSICDIDLELLFGPGYSKLNRWTSGIMVSGFNGVDINKKCHWSVYNAKNIIQLQENTNIYIVDGLFVRNIKKNGTSQIPYHLFDYYYKYKTVDDYSVVDISFTPNNFTCRYVQQKTKDAGDGYLYVNHLAQEELEKRKTVCDSVAYIVDGMIVNDSISVCKLVTLRKKWISSVSIDFRDDIMRVDLSLKRKAK